VRGEVKPYRYRTRGQMATLGSRHGIATAGPLRFRGLDGWLVARAYHLLALPFVSRRSRVLADWASAAFFRRDVVEVV
jgi:NADH dehydrogenase